MMLNQKNTHIFFLAYNESFWHFRKNYALSKEVSVLFSSPNIPPELVEKSACCVILQYLKDASECKKNLSSSRYLANITIFCYNLCGWRYSKNFFLFLQFNSSPPKDIQWNWVFWFRKWASFDNPQIQKFHDLLRIQLWP